MFRAKIGLLIGALFTLSPSVSAQEMDAAKSLMDMKNCVKIQMDKERLACYDAAIFTLSQAVETGDVMIVDKVTVDEAKKEGFGLNLPSLSGLGRIFKSNGEPSLPDDADEVTMAVERVEPFGHKKNRFYLENGQVWVQTEPMTYRAPRRKDGEPYDAVISKAAFGSFNLRINDKGKKLKVRRVK